MGVFFLLGGLHAPRGGSALDLCGGVSCSARHSASRSPLGICGSSHCRLIRCRLAGRHWITCSTTFPFAKVLKLVFTGSGECAKVEPILGLPMPAWTLLWFICLGRAGHRGRAPARGLRNEYVHP